MNVNRLFVAAAGMAIGYAVLREWTLSPPKGVTPVRQFDLSGYLGGWYEVGRLENRFERGLIRTTAEYSLNTNGTVRVVNRGYDPSSGREKEAIGTAKFVGDRNVGALKVSFFWPFYGGYNVIDLGPGYEWAIIVGSSRRYYWVLSRNPLPSEALRSRAELMAREIGIEPAEIFWVPQA